LVRSYLRRANLSEANLTRANLFEANLAGTNFSRALASQTNLTGAVLEDTVLVELRGEPIFDVLSDPSSSPIAPFGWPAARLAEQQLAEFAESYLISLGWEIVQPTSSEHPVVDLMARREDTWLLLEVKAAVLPSSSTFAHIAKQLRRAAEQYDKASTALVIPGPIPERLRGVADTNQVDVLSVRVDSGTVWVDSDGKSARVRKALQPLTIKVVCDLPHAGEVQATETVKFRFEGLEYEVDLCATHANEMRKSLNQYIEKARKASGGRGRRQVKVTTKRRRSEDIRAWAARRGLKVSQRGRIPAEIVDEYKAAER
jgi:hypothetical protein